MKSQQRKEYQKAYYEANKAKMKAKMKKYYEANKDKVKAYRQAHAEQYNAYAIAYRKADVNSFGETKSIIRTKSQQILKKMNLNIPRYEIHHCFGYDDPSKFIYISKSLHRKIHQFLRDNNIDASSDHWAEIRDMVNTTYEFVFIKR